MSMTVRGKRLKPGDASDESVNEEPGRAPALALSDVSRKFRLSRSKSVVALEHLDLSIAQGEFVALVGPSGCGKSTVLRMIAGLDNPTTGEVQVSGEPPEALAKSHQLGVAFQDHALLPWLSVRGNVALPYRVAGRKVDHERVRELVELVGLGKFIDARPAQLSGGCGSAPPSPAPCFCSPRCCCWTSRSGHSTPSPGVG